ncbi:hypothetical protein O181_018019 [Austropuccinia psidii MF-1]|uniref:Reverse transcriptase domain-containing protein n=1 Tax=Austropuccinia psidii MF-1 TaxID=1389203 RepID=A0A9Q3C4H3_9BASI|nr:hypothetical protein [Austropuccinia psidii MF-1]
MKFGIKHAPENFKRMLETIFQEEILEGWMEEYIDDIIIYSETWEYYLQYIDGVLILALGHKISGLSLDIDQKNKSEALWKPGPNNIKEMQSFLGLARYYISHIQNLSHRSSTPYRLCSKDVVFKITKEIRDSYESIKHEINNEPVLMPPDFELPFKLYIDAACIQGL